ncbi:hypothetical protein GDO81_009159 [Engystomops pustulosus]|uniref:Uncharacterized protein n=1 Tax=Engystomops pustulosus TaxID=76066 RepID=A0AAV7BPX9_ENGPU|nr:hypothetical protein GDO81_009159 [Engystomops pustulosus]
MADSCRPLCFGVPYLDLLDLQEKIHSPGLAGAESGQETAGNRLEYVETHLQVGTGGVCSKSTKRPEPFSFLVLLSPLGFFRSS